DVKTWESVPAERRPTATMLEAALAFRSALLDEPTVAQPPSDLAVLVVTGTGRPTIGKVNSSRPRVGSGPFDSIETAHFESSPTVDGDSRVSMDACMPPKPLDYKVHKTTADHVNLLNDEGVQEAIRAFLAR
ncbi:MAG: hypothetical protein ACAI25_03735, partial [Planctomycetota bacterium]